MTLAVAAAGLASRHSALHHRHVVVDGLALVQVQRAGELLEVDHVRQVALGEAQDAERAARRGVGARGERDDLDGHVRAARRPRAGAAAGARMTPGRPAGRRSTASSSTAHRCTGPGSASRAWRAIRRPTRCSISAGRGAVVAEQRDRARVVLGLQQPGNELDLVGPDAGRGLLQADVGLEPGGQHVGVVVPPAVRAGAAGQLAQRLALLLVGHLVEGEQVGDVAVLEADPAGLQPADLGAGRPDHARRRPPA